MRNQIKNTLHIGIEASKNSYRSQVLELKH